MTATTQSHPYDLPSEECVFLVCAFIESLLSQKRPSSASLQRQPDLPTPPEEPHNGPSSENGDCLSPSRPPRRSLDYVAERPNGLITHVLGEEYGIGDRYGEVDVQQQRERIALRFSSKSTPKIGILDYLERIRKYNDVRTPMLLTLAVYLDRLYFQPFNELNIHRFVLAGLRIAAKFLEDLVWKHDRYAKVVGVSSRELSRLELGFLFLIEFEIVVNNEHLADMAFRLRQAFGSGN